MNFKIKNNIYINRPFHPHNQHFTLHQDYFILNYLKINYLLAFSIHHIKQDYQFALLYSVHFLHLKCHKLNITPYYNSQSLQIIFYLSLNI
jgi:hypothetical protein